MMRSHVVTWRNTLYFSGVALLLYTLFYTLGPANEYFELKQLYGRISTNGSEAIAKKPTVAKLPEDLPSYSPKRYLKDREGFRRYVEYLNIKEEPLPKQEQAVIILTNARSGSSFFGELFLQHPDVFYMYEPLWPLGSHFICETNLRKRIEVLQRLVQCDLPNWQKVYEDIPAERQINRSNEILNGCYVKGVCFSPRTTEVCSDRHCPRNTSRIENCARDCGIVNLGALSNDCRKKKLVAMKVLRMCDINDIEGIAKKISTKIKILHLIRDPRGIANSFCELPNRDPLAKCTTTPTGTCKRQAHNFKIGYHDPPGWLKGNYKVVRYEDLATHPYEMARSIYEFAGLSFPFEVMQWIEKNTKTKMPTKVLNHIVKRGVDKPYGTSRDSKEVVQKWTKRLPYDTVKRIDKVCSDIMKMAGYRTVGSLEEYRAQNTTYFTDKIQAASIL